ncbi:MAG TPA: TIGR03808 family TAT-translocated repetitive protein, partial [Hyphomicrobiaceae bacterium]|nr:TIGR03808 family TAT-translocated repetitive protein [Hyphomicrobiaceae bacterium]
MRIDRRFLLGLSLGAGLAPVAAQAAGSAAREGPDPAASGHVSAAAFGVAGNTGRDQTERLQHAIDTAARSGRTLVIPAGRYMTGRITLPDGASIEGSAGKTEIVLVGQAAGWVAGKAHRVALRALTFDGASTGSNASGSGMGTRTALLAFGDVASLSLEGLGLRHGPGNGVRLERCGGKISNCQIEGVRHAGIFSTDARSLDITGNQISTCGDNGILVWRSSPGHDGTLVAGNRISHIRAQSGGTGQNGNGVNVFRADGVRISGNMISDCAYSAVRGNTASDIAITDNTCHRI